jgi:predicted O-methyltransferase YrrM
MRLKSFLNPGTYLQSIRRRLMAAKHRMDPNAKGTDCYAAGHYYSPLLDLTGLSPDQEGYPHDGVENWEHIDLRGKAQNALYLELLLDHPPMAFPEAKSPMYRYFSKNDFFPVSDAYTLSAMIRRFQPRQIVEVGSGFSSAVTMDTLDQSHLTAKLTFIEPYPERLYSLLTDADKANATIIPHPVQSCPLEVFDALEENDILFIDSSHVAKVGSDVSFLLLRILPRLKKGVLVHIHDIFYPYTMPYSWIYQGRAWNESLFLRAFLQGNTGYEVVAFNPFAAATFPKIFRQSFPKFLDNPGGSIWLRKL